MANRLKTTWRRWFNRKRRRAEQLSAEPVAAERTAERALEKGRAVGKLRQMWDDVQVLVRLVRAWARGEYRDVSRSTIVMVLGALVYFVSPIDAILDTIPLIGYVDDAAVIAWVVSEVRVELDAFRSWEARTRPAAPLLEA